MKRVHSISFFRHSACGYESVSAGTSQGIFYANFLPTMVRAHHAVWRGWELRIHHDERVKGFSYFKTLERMQEAGLLTLKPMGEAKSLCGAMLWRLDPLHDPDVEWVMCRDIDSLPMHRERIMVEEAIASGAMAHAILDSESHSGPLMGGMTAFNAPAMAEIFHYMRTPDDPSMNVHGSDQRWLNLEVWGKIARRTFIHQKRRDILYREALKTKMVASQVTELDLVVRHLGAGYDTKKAMEVLERDYPSGIIRECEAG